MDVCSAPFKPTLYDYTLKYPTNIVFIFSAIDATLSKHDEMMVPSAVHFNLEMSHYKREKQSLPCGRTLTEL